VTSVAQSACLHEIKGFRAVKLLDTTPTVDTFFDFRAAYRSEHLPLKYEQLVPHPRHTAAEQDCPDQGLVYGEFCLA
jgi:hypothetical protein